MDLRCPCDFNFGHAVQLRERRRYGVAQLLEPFPVVGPDHNVKMCFDWKSPFGGRFLEELVYRVAGYGVLAGICGKGLKPQAFTLQLLNSLLRVFDKKVLVIDMVRRQQLSYG